MTRARKREEPPGGWLRCAHVYPEGSACAFKARWRADGGGDREQWWCGMHDPRRPRCENDLAHPFDEAVRLKLLNLGAVADAEFGPFRDPFKPQAVGVFTEERMHLCGPCARGLPASVEFGIPATVRVPCTLCRGSGVIHDESETPHPCPCTPLGRELANGAPDAVVLARLAGE